MFEKYMVSDSQEGEMVIKAIRYEINNPNPRVYDRYKNKHLRSPKREEFIAEITIYEQQRFKEIFGNTESLAA